MDIDRGEFEGNAAPGRNLLRGDYLVKRFAGGLGGAMRRSIIYFNMESQFGHVRRHALANLCIGKRARAGLHIVG
jgi:hypothetical protein